MLTFCFVLSLRSIIVLKLKKLEQNFDAFKEIEKQGLANLLPSIGISVSRSKIEQERSDGGGLR